MTIQIRVSLGKFRLREHHVLPTKGFQLVQTHLKARHNCRGMQRCLPVKRMAGSLTACLCMEHVHRMFAGLIY